VAIVLVAGGFLLTAHCFRTEVGIDDNRSLLVASITSARPHVQRLDRFPGSAAALSASLLPNDFMAASLLLVKRIASAYDRPSVATIFQALFTSWYFLHIGVAAL